VALANLNQLGPDHLESTRLTVAFRVDAPHELDLDVFEAKTPTLATSHGSITSAPFRTLWRSTGAIFWPICLCFMRWHIWNSFYWPLLVLSSEELCTVPLALSVFSQQGGAQPQYMMAVTMLLTLPMVILFFRCSGIIWQA
jgi:hypothetical protein